jgi:dUTPase
VRIFAIPSFNKSGADNQLSSDNKVLAPSVGELTFTYEAFEPKIGLPAREGFDIKVHKKIAINQNGATIENTGLFAELAEASPNILLAHFPRTGTLMKRDSHYCVGFEHGGEIKTRLYKFGESSSVKEEDKVINPGESVSQLIPVEVSTDYEQEGMGSDLSIERLNRTYKIRLVKDEILPPKQKIILTTSMKKPEKLLQNHEAFYAQDEGLMRSNVILFKEPSEDNGQICFSLYNHSEKEKTLQNNTLLGEMAMVKIVLIKEGEPEEGRVFKREREEIAWNLPNGFSVAPEREYKISSRKPSQALASKGSNGSSGR